MCELHRTTTHKSVSSMTKRMIITFKHYWTSTSNCSNKTTSVKEMSLSENGYFKWHLHRFRCCCLLPIDCRTCPGVSWASHFPSSQIVPSNWSHLNMFARAHPSPHLKRYLDRFRRFARLTSENPYTGRPSPSKLLNSHLNTKYLSSLITLMLKPARSV